MSRRNVGSVHIEWNEPFPGAAIRRGTEPRAIELINADPGKVSFGDV